MAVPKRKMTKARRDSRRAMPAVPRNEDAAPCVPGMWLL